MFILKPHEYHYICDVRNVNVAQGMVEVGNNTLHLFTTTMVMAQGGNTIVVQGDVAIVQGGTWLCFKGGT